MQQDMIFVFVLICFSWIFFRSASLTEAIDYIKLMVSNRFFPDLLWKILPLSIVVPLIFFICIEWIFFRKEGFRAIQFKTSWISWPIYAGILILVLMKMSFHASSDFIYFQF